MKLANHTQSNCDVLRYMDGSLCFRSYDTDVIYVTPTADGRTAFICTGTYSHTTRRQIAWFLEEFFPYLTYKDMKTIVGKGAVIL